MEVIDLETVHRTSSGVSLKRLKKENCNFQIFPGTTQRQLEGPVEVSDVAGVHRTLRGVSK